MITRQRVHDVLEGSATGGRAGRVFQTFIFTLITLNVVALILETVKAIGDAAPLLFKGFEEVSVAIFSVEYVLRLWSSTVVEKYRRPILGRIRFALTPLAIVDLLAILPTLLSHSGTGRVLRILRFSRLSRILRIAKLGRYSTALSTLGRVVVAKRAELLTTFSILLVLLILTSSLMYEAENEAQADKFSSIPAAMWWGVATLTTIGYGDIYPVTDAGKLLAGVVSVLGIGMFALPTGILGAAFVEEIQGAKKQPSACPHCGKELS